MVRRMAKRTPKARPAPKLEYERELWAKGLVHIAGCDEAGVGPLAGPVVAGAAIFAPEFTIEGVDDSKTLSHAEHVRLAGEIRKHAVAWGIGEASPEEIDTLNIHQAGLLAMRRALEALQVRPQHVLLDARLVPAFRVAQTKIIKGDAKSHTIGAASILAKAHRDALMVKLDEEYPGYGFAVHKGYPVPAHFEALRRLGACAIHRRSYAPVREALGLVPTQAKLL